MVAIANMYYTLCREGENKKIIFLANTIQLVKQQAESIKKNLYRIMQDEAGVSKEIRGDRAAIVKWS